MVSLPVDPEVVKYCEAKERPKLSRNFSADSVEDKDGEEDDELPAEEAEDLDEVDRGVLFPSTFFIGL